MLIALVRRIGSGRHSDRPRSVDARGAERPDVAARAVPRFSRILGFGIVLTFGLQAVINLAVVDRSGAHQGHRASAGEPGRYWLDSDGVFAGADHLDGPPGLADRAGGAGLADDQDQPINTSAVHARRCGTRMTPRTVHSGADRLRRRRYGRNGGPGHRRRGTARRDREPTLEDRLSSAPIAPSIDRLLGPGGWDHALPRSARSPGSPPRGRPSGSLRGWIADPSDRRVGDRPGRPESVKRRRPRWIRRSARGSGGGPSGGPRSIFSISIASPVVPTSWIAQAGRLAASDRGAHAIFPTFGAAGRGAAQAERSLPDGPASRVQPRSALGLRPDRPTLLVTGASQGAASIDRILARPGGPRHIELVRWLADPASRGDGHGRRPRTGRIRSPGSPRSSDPSSSGWATPGAPRTSRSPGGARVRSRRLRRVGPPRS